MRRFEIEKLAKSRPFLRTGLLLLFGSTAVFAAAFLPLNNALGVGVGLVLGICVTWLIRPFGRPQSAAEAERDALADTAAALNGTLDFDEVLTRILVNAERVVTYDMANIMLVEGDIARSARQRCGTGQEAAGRRLADSLVISETASLLTKIRTGRAMVSPDTQKDPAWLDLPETHWIRSHVSAPIRVRGRLLGFLNLDSATPYFYDEGCAQRLQAFADQAAIALDNAHLLSETRQRASEFAVLYQMAGDLATQRDLPGLLTLLVERAAVLLQAPGGAIFQYDPAHAELDLAVVHGVRLEGSVKRFKLGEGLAGRVAQERSPLIVADYAHWEGRSGRALAEHIRAMLGVPMLYGGELIGVLVVFETGGPRQFCSNEARLLTLFAGQAASAVHNTRLYEQTLKHVRRLDALHTIDMSINASLDLGVVFNIMLDQITTQLEVDAAAILSLDSLNYRLEWMAGRGFRRLVGVAASLPLGEGLPGPVLETRRIQCVPDIGPLLAREPRHELLAGEGFVSYCGLPLIAKGQIRGVLEIFSRSQLEPDVEWLDFVETLAGQAAIAIENNDLFKELQQSNLELTLAYGATIEGWSRALDLRDKETEGHTQRVTEMTLRLGRAIGMSDAQLIQARYGALLHDIGKMGIPDRILFKPGPLAPEEQAVMRRHPDYAYQLLSPIPFLRQALDIPYGHHERWDGSGYPRGLRGEEIPLAARIFAVVDVWDALLSDRHYRPAWSPEEARAYIASQAGKHFDPQVVAVFLECF